MRGSREVKAGLMELRLVGSNQYPTVAGEAQRGSYGRPNQKQQLFAQCNAAVRFSV